MTARNETKPAETAKNVPEIEASAIPKSTYAALGKVTLAAMHREAERAAQEAEKADEP